MPSPPLTQPVIPVVQPIRFLEPKSRNKLRILELADPFPATVQSRSRVAIEEVLPIPIAIRSRNRIVIGEAESALIQSRNRVVFEDLGPFSLLPRSRSQAQIFDALAARSRTRIQVTDVARARSRTRVTFTETAAEVMIAQWLMNADPWADTVAGLALTRNGSPSDPDIVLDGASNVTRWNGASIFNGLNANMSTLATQVAGGNWTWRLTFDIQINDSGVGDFITWGNEWRFYFFGITGQFFVNHASGTDGVSSSVLFALGTWYSVELRYDVTTMSIKVNSTTDQINTTGVPPSRTPTTVNFGDYPAGETRLRNVRFYRTLLVPR